MATGTGLEFANFLYAVTISKLIREPLAHFLLAGAILFCAVSWLGGVSSDPRDITISRQDLLNYLQARAQVYDAEGFDPILKAMGDEERRALARDVALQEALFREGTKMGLQEVDPVIRVRVVQQMRLFLEEAAMADVSVTAAEVEAYYNRHLDEYRSDRSISFTHIFFAETTIDRDAEKIARDLLSQLRADGAAPAEASRYGDRFLYRLNYADANARSIINEFGVEFVDDIFKISSGAWRGPLRSDHGWHLVFVSRVQRERILAFEEVQPRVQDDALAEKREAAMDETLDELLDRYQINVTYE